MNIPKMVPSEPITSFLAQDKSDPSPKKKYEIVPMSLEEEMEWLAENGGPVECDNKMCPVWDRCEGGLKRYRDLGIIPRPENESEIDTATAHQVEFENFSHEAEQSLSPEHYPWLKKGIRGSK